nr:uncharacterized protein LOC116839027 [Chelonoidis abingdonii]
MLAWLQILLRLVLSEGTEGPGASPDSQQPTQVPAPPAPSLSLSPPSPVRGQQVQLTCSAPRGSRALGFIFYEQRSGSWEKLWSESNGTWRIITENSELSRTFTCSYRVQSSPPRQPHSQSLQSNAVTLLLAAWSLPVPLVAGCGGAATALALLLLLICLCRKKAAASRRLSTSYWKSQELRRSRIMRRSTDISGVNMGLQQMTEGGWPQAASQDWGLLPKLPTEGPRPGQAAVGAAPLKGQKEEDDADSGAEFEFPDIDQRTHKSRSPASPCRHGPELARPPWNTCTAPLTCDHGTPTLPLPATRGVTLQQPSFCTPPAARGLGVTAAGSQTPGVSS